MLGFCATVVKRQVEDGDFVVGQLRRRTMKKNEGRREDPNVAIDADANPCLLLKGLSV
jgi:hypothetical protein